MMSSLFALWAGVLLALSGPVTGLSIVPDAERTQVLVAVDGEVEFRDFTMEGPSRLVVDLFGARHALPRDSFMDIHRGGVRSVRTSQYSPDVVRVVLELDETVPYVVVPEEGRLRILFENPAGAFEEWSTDGLAADVAADTPSPASAGSVPPTPRDEPAADRTMLEARQQVSNEPRISITFRNTPVADVANTFSEFSGRTIVLGNQVTGNINAKVVDQQWDTALEIIMAVNGFRATELESGIIRIDALSQLGQLESNEPVITRSYRVNYATAAELADALAGIVSQTTGETGTASRGTVTVNPTSNTLILTDVPRVHREAEQLIADLDQRTPQVTIQAKIIFVNRTDLDEFGVTYDLKDSAGNQLNVVAPGAQDTDGDGVITLPDEQVDVGTNVVSLGGNSVAALGNANNRVAGPTLTLLNSLVMGRHTLIAFVEALQSVNLSEIQASPMMRVMNHQQARLQVGERTPIRVVDASTGAAGQGAALPTASVQIEDSGIILEATPHIASNNDILLELRAERSAPQVTASDAGVSFTTQIAETRVLVQDGQTVVMGGLTVTEDNEVRSGIPLLMDLPVIGGLFRVTRQSQVQRDLIILVTPHIVRDEL